MAEDFTAALAAHVEDLVVGDPLDESTDVSALISTDDRDRVVAWIDEAVAAGARIVTGGRVGDDGLLRPTVLADVTPDMRVCRDEVFGPVVAVQAYAVHRRGPEAWPTTPATASRPGIYTSSLATALRAARELHFGAVLVNEVPTWRADQMPYGGVRSSGNTKEGPAAAVREMTEERLVVIKA